MTLTPHEVALIRSTFRLLEPKSHVAALAFFQRVLAENPPLRAQLAGKIDTESARLLDLLRLAAELADQPETLRARLGGGARLLPAEVAIEPAAPIDEALLWSLGATLGSDFTPPARTAWATLMATAFGPRGLGGPSRPGRPGGSTNG